jgi:hypothetical protein
MVVFSDAQYYTLLFVNESLIIHVIGYRRIRRGKSAGFFRPAACRGEYIYVGGYMYAVGFVENIERTYTLFTRIPLLQHVERLKPHTTNTLSRPSPLRLPTCSCGKLSTDCFDIFCTRKLGFDVESRVLCASWILFLIVACY